MNRFNFKNRIVPLLLGFSLFYIQAADKDTIEKQLNVKKAQPASKNERLTRAGRTTGEFIPSTENTFEKSLALINQEPSPPSHEPYGQPAGGFRFAIENTQTAPQKNNTHITTGIVSTKNTIREDVDETLLEEILNKYTNGFPLNATETAILKDNINELRVETDSFTRRPSISGQRQLSRDAADLFFSEYGEGSGSNKYLEIYNGTGADVDLSNYLIMQSTNGWQGYDNIDTLSGTLANGDVYVIANSSASNSILVEADLTESVITNFNGNDARALIKVVGGDTTILDYIGSFGSDPGIGWDVAGVTNATANHTLTRKRAVTGGNTSWTLSAGTNVTDSEWIIHDQNTWTYLGSHTMTEPNPLSEGFEGGAIPDNWTVINNDGNPNSWGAHENSFYAHTGDYFARVYLNPLGSDDWLITPRLEVASGDSIVFWAKSSSNSPADLEDFYVQVSTTTNNNVAAFTGGTIASVSNASNTWTRYAYALESYAGQEEVYVAVQCVTVNGFYLYVDDFSGPQVWIDDNPVAAVSASAIDFGNTGTGGMSSSFVISNYGATDLVVSSIAVANTDFSVSSSAATLIGGGSDTETITVTYTPMTVGGDTSFVVLTHNGSSSPDSIKVMGAGKDAIYWQDFESWAAEIGLAEPHPLGMTQEGNMSYSYDGTMHANGWEKTASSSVVFAGEYAAEFDSFEGSSSGADTSALITPAIEFEDPSIYTDPPAVEGALRFYMKKLGTEEFYVSYSNDGGLTWTKEYSDTTENYTSGSVGWKIVSVEVPVGDTYIFKFVGRANMQSLFGDVFIDEISFVEVPPTPELSLTYSAIGFMPQIIGDSTTNTAHTVGFNSGSDILAVDSIVTANEDFSVVLTTMATGDSVAPGGNVDLDIIWSPTTFGFSKTNAILYHNADTSPDTIVFSGEAGRSYVSFDGNDDFQGASFDGALPWHWVNEDADGDGDSWLFNYQYYGPGYTGNPIGFYARSPGGGNQLQTRTLLPIVGDSLIFYYNSSSAADSSNFYVKAKRMGGQLDYITTDTLQFDGGANKRAAIDLSAYSGDTIKIRLVDDVMGSNDSYHRLDDLLLPSYEVSGTGQLVFEQEEINFGEVYPSTSESITIVVSNMGTEALTFSSLISDNAAFSAVLTNSTVLAETATELTVTFIPPDGSIQSGNIIATHDAPSSPDTLVVSGGGMTYITGVVTDYETGQTLDGATVDVGSDTTQTNNYGQYGHYSFLDGLAFIQFMKEGYNSASFSAMLFDGDTVTINAALEPLALYGVYSSGFENGEDQGVSNAITGTNNFAVTDRHVTAGGDTVNPVSGMSMLVFPDSGGYANNDYVRWVADSSFDIDEAVGGLYFDLDINIDTEAGFDFFYICLILGDGVAQYNVNGTLSGSTDGWTHRRIDMSWVLGMGSQTATPAIIFSADEGVTGSGGVFDNISVTRNPFFLAPPGNISVVNYGSTIPLSWEAPTGTGRASYSVGNIDLNMSEPHPRPTVLDDNGNMVELVRGPRDYPIITVHHDYSAPPTRSLSGYNIYRTVWPFGHPKLLAFVPGTTVLDASVYEGSYYQYAVRAVYNEGESLELGPISARAGLPVVVTDDAYGGENFEANNFDWENWEAFYSTPAAMWLVGDSAAADSAFGLGGMPAPNHSNFAFISDGRGGDADFETYLLSPFIDFIDNFTAIVKLSGYAQVWGDFAENNIARLLVRSDMGPWITVLDFGYDHMEGWGDYSASIADMVSGRDKAQLALHYTHTGGLNSGNGNGVAFDDLMLEIIPGPHSLMLTPSTTDVTLNWSHPDSSLFRNLPEPILLPPNIATALSAPLEESNVSRTDCFSHGLTNSTWITGFYGPDSGSTDAPIFATLHAFNDGPMELEETIIHGYYSTDDTTSASAQVFVGVASSNGVTVDTIASDVVYFDISNTGSWTTATMDLSGQTYNSTDSTFLKVTWTPLNDGYSALFDANIWIPGQRIDNPNVVAANGLSGYDDSAGVYTASASYNFVIEVCGTPTPPDMAYNVYKNYNLIAENLDVTTLVDNAPSVIMMESCYWVHGVMPMDFNIGTTVLNVIQETDPSNVACGTVINTPPGQFQLISPDDGETIVIRPENIDQSQLFAWSSSLDTNGSTVTYRALWWGMVANDSVAFAVDTSASYLYLTYQDIADTLLAYSGVETATFQWTVVSSDQLSSTEAENGPFSVIFDVGYMLSNESEGLLPEVFALHQNYPNPFNPVTTIRFDIPEESHVKIDVYNVMGQKVAELVDTYFQPGFYTVNWSGENMLGSALSSGMYFYRIQARDFTAVKKLLLVK